jgi:hypothetical protein
MLSQLSATHAAAERKRWLAETAALQQRAEARALRSGEDGLREDDLDDDDDVRVAQSSRMLFRRGAHGRFTR